MRMLAGLAIAAVIVVALFGGVLAFGTGKAPPPLESLSQPFRDHSADFRDIPPAQTLRARDGTALAYRLLSPASGAPERVVILIHGATASGASMHPLAKTLAASGMAVYSLDIRGHGDSGRRGDLDYPTQLDDDLADVVAFIRTRHPATPLALAGFSAGGGFALHLAASPLGKSFERVVLISPMLGYRAPTARPVDKPLLTVFVPRLIAISLLNGVGIHAFDHLQTLAFGDPGRPELTFHYSFLLMNGFATRDYAADVRAAQAPLSVVVGADDQFFYAERYAPMLDAVKPGIPVTVVPGLAHIPVTLEPAGIAAIARALRGQV